MKKIKILLYGLLSTFAIVGTSCSDDYLDTNPTESVSEGDAVKTAENLAALINGMHRNMYTRQNDNQGQGGHGGLMIMMDALGEDWVLTSTATGWYNSVVRWQDQSLETSTYTAYGYQFYYSMINNANLIINKGTEATGSKDLVNASIGEAYAYRAFSNYMLVQLYGIRYDAGKNNDQLGIVLRTDFPDRAPKARATVEDTYKLINEDLDKAIGLLAKQGSAHKSHFNVKNVQGLKARVALTQGNWKLAAENAVLAKGSTKLMDAETYKKGFNSVGVDEWMWGSEVRADQGSKFTLFGAYMARNANTSNVKGAPKAMNKLLFDKFPSSDVRTQLVDPSGKHTSLGLSTKDYKFFPYTSQKFLRVGDVMDVVYMRASEMYLIEAEALYHLGNIEGSKEALTTLVKARDANYVRSTKTGDDYLEEVLDNRRLELWGEGFRFLDLKRLNKGLDRQNSNHDRSVINNVYTMPAGDLNWQYVIPRKEILANPLIVQNEMGK